MSTIATATLAVRAEVDALYAEYAFAADEELERWPDFFTPTAFYQVISRENHERNLPLATIRCEGMGMLQDRVVAVRKTSYFEPRYLRHIISCARIIADDGTTIRAQANFAVYTTSNDGASSLLVVGTYIDRIVRYECELKFSEKLCVFDGAMVPGSIIYPV